MEAAVERLRASKERVTNEEKVLGHAAGRRWATEDAEFDELKRLDRWEPSNIDPDELAWEAYRIIADEEKPHGDDLRRFWENVVGVTTPSDDLN